MSENKKGEQYALRSTNTKEEMKTDKIEIEKGTKDTDKHIEKHVKDNRLNKEKAL